MSSFLLVTSAFSFNLVKQSTKLQKKKKKKIKISATKVNNDISYVPLKEFLIRSQIEEKKSSQVS